MSKCFRKRISNTGNWVWGYGDIDYSRKDIEASIVRYARLGFRTMHKDEISSNFWVVPYYFDDKYYKVTKTFFSEAGVLLFPKRVNTELELTELNCNRPKSVQNINSIAEWEQNEQEWRNYKWRKRNIIHQDIQHCIDDGIKPLHYVIEGVRFSPDCSGVYLGDIKKVTYVDYFVDDYNEVVEEDYTNLFIHKEAEQ